MVVHEHPNARAIRAGARRVTLHPQPSAVWAQRAADARIDALIQRRRIRKLIRSRRSK